MLGTRVIVRQDVADIACVAARAAHTAPHTSRINHPQRPRCLTGGRCAQGDLGVARGAHAQAVARRHVDGSRRHVVEHTVAHTQSGKALTLHGHIDRAAEHHQAQFLVAGIQAFGLAGCQTQGAKADIRPACTLGCDVDNLTALRRRLDQQGAHHLKHPPGFCSGDRQCRVMSGSLFARRHSWGPVPGLALLPPPASPGNRLHAECSKWRRNQSHRRPAR